MIEAAYNFAYTQVLGQNVITYIGAINFILVFTALIMGLAVDKGKVSQVTFETVAYFTLAVTLINGILGLLLLL